MMAKRRNGRPGPANAKKNKSKKIRYAEPEVAEDQDINKDLTGTRDLKRVYLALFILCISIYFFVITFASSRGLDIKSMLSLQWDVALEQWTSKVSPRLASPHLSMAFFMFQDAAFVCALAWSVSFPDYFLLWVRSSKCTVGSSIGFGKSIKSLWKSFKSSWDWTFLLYLKFPWLVSHLTLFCCIGSLRTTRLQTSSTPLRLMESKVRILPWKSPDSTVTLTCGTSSR